MAEFPSWTWSPWPAVGGRVPDPSWCSYSSMPSAMQSTIRVERESLLQ